MYPEILLNKCIENGRPTGEISYMTDDINENILKSLDRSKLLPLKLYKHS
jgi:hypothetical protein